MKILITGGNGNIAKMIKHNLSNHYDITNPSRKELNILNIDEIRTFLDKTKYDILIHTAILGGRRTKEDNADEVYINLRMFENILSFADQFKMIINLDSGAIYDRSTDIFHRKEEELITIPSDYYGFSKYIIYKRSLSYENVYNIRIFNIFHTKEESNRFIKACFLSKQNKRPFSIFENKYFDFVYEDDFIQIIQYYIENALTSSKIDKVLNISYDKKYTLSDIAEMIMENDSTNIDILNNDLQKNYCGDGTQLQKLGLPLLGLEKCLQLYEEKMVVEMNNGVTNNTC